MAQALPAIDNINVLMVPLKLQHWVGLDTHTDGNTMEQKTMLWFSFEFQLHFVDLRKPDWSEIYDILNSWLELSFKVFYTGSLKSIL